MTCGNGQTICRNAMRFLNLFLFIILFHSCRTNTSVIESRYNFNKLNLTAYSWNFDHLTSEYKFYVGLNLEIDSDGNCHIFRRDVFMQEGKYFSTNLPKEFDSLISKINFTGLDSLYEPDSNDLVIYCGLKYCLMYQDKELLTKKYIQFIPKELPQHLRVFFDSLETFAYKIDSLSIRPFDYTKIPQYIEANLEDTTKLPKFDGTIKFDPPPYNRIIK